MENHRVFAMKLREIYPLLVAKAERKGRTRQEVHSVIFWLLGYTEESLQACMDKDVDYRTFLADAPCLHPNSHRITGSVCGVKVQEISDPQMRRLRYLDKLVDELAKGKPLEKVLRG